MDDSRFAMANAVRGGGRIFGASSGEVVVVSAVAAAGSTFRTDHAKASKLRSSRDFRGRRFGGDLSRDVHQSEQVAKQS